MSKFLVDGNRYRVYNDMALDIRNALPVGTYAVKFSMEIGYYLEGIGDFELPPKLYGDCLSNADRIMNTFHKRHGSTGVLLCGEKGSGKTLLAKKLSEIAREHNMPTLVINQSHCGEQFNQFIQAIDTPSVIIFDEFEKVYDADEQQALLTLLDGVYATKKLFILTSNGWNRIDSHMKCRPGRIFYYLNYDGLDEAFIREYCADKLIDQSKTDSVVMFGALHYRFNFDMLQALVEEMNRYGETAMDAARILNVRPEFDSHDHFKLTAYYDGEVVDYENLGSVDSDGELNLNPLAPWTFEYKVADENDQDDYEWRDLRINPNYVTKMDYSKGYYEYTIENWKITLQKIRSEKFGFDQVAARWHDWRDAV